ncbi:MAG: hypothetical protein MUO21_12135, partial [Nitrososphaeraceae archaeon]|nr:hypothetical protein [Nitrososphaeraceae archaeon]
GYSPSLELSILSLICKLIYYDHKFSLTPFIRSFREVSYRLWKQPIAKSCNLTSKIFGSEDYFINIEKIRWFTLFKCTLTRESIS